jgi:hypothetical protein
VMPRKCASACTESFWPIAFNRNGAARPLLWCCKSHWAVTEGVGMHSSMRKCRRAGSPVHLTQAR